jgi:hypothetical protein
MENNDTSLDFIVVLAQLKNGNIHQVALRPETRLAIANFIAMQEGSLRLLEEPIDGLKLEYLKLPDISKLTRDQVVPIYVDHITSDPPEHITKALNELIIERWSNKALIYIKEKAWKEIRNNYENGK